MLRILLLLLILWMCYRLMAELMARVRSELEGESGVPAEGDEATPERLVPCHQCGVHLAESRVVAFPSGGEGAFVCSPPCREFARATGTDG